ncbi:MAG: tetratricopeptide repeat protein [Schlesneria sp.]|nr:tetratricopeptide repeat protein [Schlesneria sp.]
MADLNRAIEIQPDRGMGYRNRGFLFQAQGRHEQAIADYDAAIRLDAMDVEAYVYRAIEQELRRRLADAIVDCDKAIQLVPRFSLPYERLARIHATSMNAAFRDGERAIGYATTACELSRWQDPDPIATLAAAYAEAGRFEKAVELQEMAETVAETAAKKSLADKIAKVRARELEQLDSTDVQPAVGNTKIAKATKACADSDWKDPHKITSLARAYRDAIRWYQKAHELTLEPQRKAFQDRSKLYSAGMTFREPPKLPERRSFPVFNRPQTLSD